MCAICSSTDVSSHFYMWFLLCRCYKWFCCFCSRVYPHQYNSIVITIPIVDGFFFYFSTSKFPSYFSQIIVDLNILSINSTVMVTSLSPTLDHYLSSYSSIPLSLPRARAYIFLHPGSYVFEFHRQSHGQYQASPLQSLVGRKQ